MSKRTAFALTLGAILIVAWYGARFEGEPRPVDPLQVWSLPERPVWHGRPTPFRKSDDPAAIYVLHGLPGSDERFDALRLDLNSGARSSARIAIGPGTDFRAFDEGVRAGIASIELHGLLLPRPTPVLFRIPGPGGPALELVESATGVLHVVAGTGAGKRTLLRLTVVNSSRMEEVRSLLWSDPKGLAAFAWPEAGSWRLYVFALKPVQDRIRAPASSP